MKIFVNNINLGYSDHGAGLPVIFLHAFPLNKSMWDGDIQALLSEAANRFRLVSLDWRGFGESEIADDVSTMELFADDVAGLMDALGIQKAILCGLSMGGYAAFAFLRKYPQRLAETEGAEAIANLQLPRLISDYTRQHHPEVEIRVRQMINAATPRGIAAASRGMAQRLDSMDLLASIACPTLVIVGEQDGLTPPDVAREYAAQIPGAQFALIPRAGHLSNLEQPEAFFSAIHTFLYSI